MGVLDPVEHEEQQRPPGGVEQLPQVFLVAGGGCRCLQNDALMIGARNHLVQQ